MNYSVMLFSKSKDNLKKFLSLFYNFEIDLSGNYYEKLYGNPIDMVELISTIIDNSEKFQNIGIWINIDKNIFINITENNLEKIIKYLFERYP